MKNLFVILVVILISGCHVTKKVTESRVISDKTTEVKESTATQWLVSIDTTKQSDTKITYRKTEYYPPASNPPFDTPLATQGSAMAEVVEAGAVKSVETLTIKKTTEAKGKTEAVKTEGTVTSSLISESTDTKTELKEKPAPDPKRFMWIFLILALLTGIAIYLKRSGVFSWLKSVLCKLGKFLKI